MPKKTYKAEDIRNKLREAEVLRFSQPLYAGYATAALWVNEKPEPDGHWFRINSGEWIRTTDLRVMSQDPKSVPFWGQVVQNS